MDYFWRNMKAIQYTKYGSTENLQLKDVEKPIPKENQVLIKVHCSAINDWDWAMVIGTPLLYRLMTGLFKPKNKTPGMELSGTIESVGALVSTFKKGDMVYGDISDHGFGTFAEYICIDEKAIVHKPKNMSFEDAAAIPHAAMLAVQGLIDKGALQNHQKILINGAGGGVGTLGVQIAKQYNAHVTGVDSGDKHTMMQSLGFDEVIDYTQVDFTKNGMHYDLILDAKTNRSPLTYLKALKPGGVYVTVGGHLPRLLQHFLCGPIISKIFKKRFKIVALKPNKDLDYIHKLYESGDLKCSIDGPYSLSEVPQALQSFGEGKHQGKIIISVRD